jgi:hypothetical protein
MFDGLASALPMCSERIAAYKRRENMTIWVGAGLGALVVLVAGNVPEIVGGGEVPAWLIGVTLTALLVSAGLLALARVGFEYAATQLQRDLDRGELKVDSELRGRRGRWPKHPEIYWRLSFWLLLAAAAGFLVAVWWSVLAA